jgi:hypothetical protein
VKTPDGLNATMEEFDREIGIERLVAVHANDSKAPLGGGLDRHANIGEGHIGEDGFINILRHPAFADVPFLLEVPGTDDSTTAARTSPTSTPSSASASRRSTSAQSIIPSRTARTPASVRTLAPILARMLEMCVCTVR